MKSIILLFALFFTLSITAQNEDTVIKDVKQAAFNYIDAFYKVDTTLAYKSVHKNLRKVGWWYDEKKKAYSGDIEMPFDALISLAKKWNINGDRVNDQSPRKVDILEVSDKIAAVKITAV